MVRLALVAALVTLSSSGQGDRHPDVGRDALTVSCEECHAKATPAIVEEWSGGKHGLLLVKCLVCHGSIGKDFVEHVPATRCAGCHPSRTQELAARAKSASAAKGKKSAERAADCFSCHAPHSLAPREGAPNPHAAP